MEDQEEVEVEIQQLQDQVIHLPLALLKEIQVEQEFLQDLIMVQAVEVEQELLELMVLVLQQEMVELGLHPVLQLVQWLELVVVEVVLFVVLVAELEDQVCVQTLSLTSLERSTPPVCCPPFQRPADEVNKPVPLLQVSETLVR